MMRTILVISLFYCFAVNVFAGVPYTSAKIYKKQGEYAKALEFFDIAVAEEPGDADVLFDRGQLLGEIAMEDEHAGLRKRASGDAENPRRALLERMIKDFDAVRAIGDEKKNKKNLKKIDEQVSKYWWTFYAVAVEADSVYRAADAAGDSVNAQGAVKKGLPAAETAIMLDPKHWSSRFVYAQLRGFQFKDDGFVKAWEEALGALDNSSLKSEEPDKYKSNVEYARLQLIQYYYSKLDHPNTLLLADQLLAADSGSVEAVQYKAFSLAAMAGDEARPGTERDSLKRVALGALNAAKVANQEDENIVFYIGQFNLQLKDTAAALAAFDEFLTKAPDDRDVLFTEGLIYLEGDKFGDTQKAVEKFGAIKDANPEDGPAWINYGIALIRLGRNEEGTKAVKKGEALPGK